MSQPIVGYLDPWYFEFLEEVSAMLAEVWQTSQRAFAVAGAGSAGMEAGLVSLLEPFAQIGRVVGLNRQRRVLGSGQRNAAGALSLSARPSLRADALP